ncbi:hypothetical protein FHG87_001729 [Trinorchestia longiramus]|nr:hypothetical protein FHG87_001729 [Trinorchestia longiramus]
MIDRGRRPLFPSNRPQFTTAFDGILIVCDMVTVGPLAQDENMKYTIHGRVVPEFNWFSVIVLGDMNGHVVYLVGG